MGPCHFLSRLYSGSGPRTFAGLLVLPSGGDEIPEERVGSEGSRFELGMKLNRQEPGMVRDLDDLDELGVGCATSDEKAGLGQNFFVFPIELEAVAVALGYLQSAIGPMGQRPGFENTGISAQAHGPAQLFDIHEVLELDDEPGRGIHVAFCRAGIGQTANRPSVLHHRGG